MQNNTSISQLKQQTKEAIDHVDHFLADEILRKINRGLISDPEILDFKSQLQIVNFPNLNDNEAALIFQNNLLDFFRMQISLGNSLNSRYQAKETYLRENQRLLLKKAILQNSEKLGAFTIGQWLKKFESQYRLDERSAREILEFLVNAPEAKTLNPIQRNALKEIIHVYDDYLASRIIDLYDIIDAQKRIREKGIPEKLLLPKAPYVEYGERPVVPIKKPETLQRPEYTPKRETMVTPQPPTERELITTEMPFKIAVEKYSGIYEQLISSAPINISTSPNPLRPTIRNWIRDYYDIMGTGKHTSLERSKYLYNSPNARLLSSKERERLFEIIRSIEENVALSIDTTNQKIIFKPSTTTEQPSVAKPMSQLGQQKTFPKSQQMTQLRPLQSQTYHELPAQNERFETSQQPTPTINRARSNNMELGSTFHNTEAMRNVSSMSFDAPHTLPNENNEE